MNEIRNKSRPDHFLKLGKNIIPFLWQKNRNKSCSGLCSVFVFLYMRMTVDQSRN